MKKIILLILFILFMFGCVYIPDNKMKVRFVSFENENTNKCRYSLIRYSGGFFIQEIILIEECGLFKPGDMVKIIKE